MHCHEPPLRLALVLPPAARAVCAVDPSRVAIVQVFDGGPFVRLAPLSVDCATGLVTVELRHTSGVGALTLPAGTTIPFRVWLPLQ